MNKTPLERVIEICGGQTGLSEKSGVKQVTISAWVNRFGHRVGSEYVLAVSRASDWQITPHELRPDLYPHKFDALPEHLRFEEKVA